MDDLMRKIIADLLADSCADRFIDIYMRKLLMNLIKVINSEQLIKSLDKTDSEFIDSMNIVEEKTKRHLPDEVKEQINLISKQIRKEFLKLYAKT